MQSPPLLKLPQKLSSDMLETEQIDEIDEVVVFKLLSVVSIGESSELLTEVEEEEDEEASSDEKREELLLLLLLLRIGELIDIGTALVERSDEANSDSSVRRFSAR